MEKDLNQEHTTKSSKKNQQPKVVEVTITNLRKDIFTYFNKVHTEKTTILVKKAGIEVGYLVPTE